MLVFLLGGQALHAATVRVNWVANTEADLAGYRVYYGLQSRSYAQSLGQGLEVVTNSIEIEALEAGTTYYFAVTAFDDTGNESAYSEEVSLAVPEESVVATDTDQDGIPDYIEQSWGGNANDARDAWADPDLDGVVNLVEYRAGTNPLDSEDTPQTGQVVEGVVVTSLVQDFIAEVGEVIDVYAALAIDETYTVTALEAGDAPIPDAGTLTATVPGTYLYNVTTLEGELFCLLRLSVTEYLFAVSGYEPGSALQLADETLGVSLWLGADALVQGLNLGIGQSADLSSEALSEALADLVEFDLLPFDLTLGSPATVSVYYYTEDNPVVERYDALQEDWISIGSSYDVAESLVSFSTQYLGRYRIYAQEEDENPQSDTSSSATLAAGAGGGGGGGGCFIGTAGF